jgi:RNA polymerase sigma-70 factor (ECF subfamily)
MQAPELAQEYERLRPELTAYLTRLVARVTVAEDLAQETALRALQAVDSAPVRVEELRPWLFRIATNLGIDELRRHKPWRETVMLDLKKAAIANPAFVGAAEPWRGSPEMVAVAREHLVACFSCTLGQLPPGQAAALLLKEVYGFTIEEVADILEARFAQVKNWLQSARATMKQRYDRTCALITKQGVCHQCVELDGSFRANRGSPLAGTSGQVDDRLRILQEMRDQPAGRWTRMLSELLDEIG